MIRSNLIGDTKMEFTGERVVPSMMKSENIHIYQEHLARYTFALPYCVGKTVLDVACGSGYGTDMLSVVASDVIGVDIDEASIDYARRRYDPDNFRQWDLNCGLWKGTLPSASYADTVVSFETIEHLKEYDVFIRSVKESGAAFVCSIPFKVPSKFHISDSEEHFLEMCESLMRHFPDMTFMYQHGQNFYDAPDPLWSHYYQIGVSA